MLPAFNCCYATVGLLLKVPITSDFYGITVSKTIDTIIATHCIHHHHTLLHSDKDFKPFDQHPELNTFQPL